jgi:hypothetical protein
MNIFNIKDSFFRRCYYTHSNYITSKTFVLHFSSQLFQKQLKIFRIIWMCDVSFVSVVLTIIWKVFPIKINTIKYWIIFKELNYWTD